MILPVEMSKQDGRKEAKEANGVRSGQMQSESDNIADSKKSETSASGRVRRRL